jgi:hypothetical protein
MHQRRSALTRFVTAHRLVDDIEAPAPAHYPIVTMPRAQRLERITDLHRLLPKNGGRDRDRTCDHYDVNVVLYR